MERKSIVGSTLTELGSFNEKATKRYDDNDVFGLSVNSNPKKTQVKGIYNVEPKKKPTKSDQNHSHPMQKNSMVEMRPKNYGSLGAVETEGCVEHSEERYILNAEALQGLKSKSKIMEYIIFSEILAKPKCKK